MSHEKSITIKRKGKFFNIPTVTSRGEELSSQEAARRHAQGKLRTLGGPFSSAHEAVRNAVVRSRRGIRFPKGRP